MLNWGEKKFVKEMLFRSTICKPNFYLDFDTDIIRDIDVRSIQLFLINGNGKSIQQIGI